MEAGGHTEKPAPASEQLFIRNATGLVRGVRPLSSLVINYIVGSPVQVLGAGLFFALSLYPGGNLYLGLALILPMMLAYSYTFGLMTAAVPRSGGDYTIVSRVIHPTLGVISSVFMLLAQFLSVAFFGIAFVTTGVVPGLNAVGLIGHNNTYINWANDISTGKGWQMALGSLVILAAGAMFIGGWRWTLRMQNGIFIITLLGVGVATAIALFTSKSGFISDFNSFAQPFTHQSDTYGNVISTASKNGVDPSPPFSLSNTWPVVGVLAGFSIYTYFSSFIGGELREARSVGTATRMGLAGVLNIVGVVVCVVVFFHSFGSEFLTAGFGGGMPASLPVSPYYFFLAAVIVKSSLLAALLAISYCLYWPLITYMVFLQPTRMLFAYAFDGLLPASVAKTSERGHVPYVAVAISIIGSIGTLWWAVYYGSSNFFQILVYAILVQLISMALVGLAAVVFPKARPELYFASATTRTFLGVPVVVIAGAGSIISSVVLWIIYFKYPALGLTNQKGLLIWIAVTIALSLVYYYGARAYQRSRGKNLDYVFSEIPPE
jgi:basic amino acid/polyamine antiporter, APA family